MQNEELIRKLIRGAIQRAIQESAAAVFILIAFAVILTHSEVGSPRYYGCLIILVGTGFIAGIVWSNALSYRLLRSHAPSDLDFWREAFHAAVCHDILDFCARVLAILVPARPGLGDLSRGFSASSAF